MAMGGGGHFCVVAVVGVVVIVCEWSWAVVAVFVCWQSLVVVLGSCSHFWVVIVESQ